MRHNKYYWTICYKYEKINAFLWANIFKYLPVKHNKIVFINFFGQGFGDSPKYIAEEIIRQELPYDLVWLIKDKKIEIPHGIRKVKLYTNNWLPTIHSIYTLSTAKVIISNVKMTPSYHKKNSQFYIQTWHGSIAFKAIEKEAQDKLDPLYIEGSKKDSTFINLFLSSNSIQTEEIKNFFWYDGEIFESGSPRNDILYRPNDEKESIKQVIGLPSESKVVLYAPTFRDDENTEYYNIDLEKIRKNLVEKTGDDWHILIRLHPNVRKKELMKTSMYVTDTTSYPDMQQLLFIADILITDYSTTIYDAAILQKVIFLYTPDLDKYKAERGLKPLYFNLNIHLCLSSQELIDHIRMFDKEEYLKNLNKFLQSITIFDDGNASWRVVKRIEKIINQ